MKRKPKYIPQQSKLSVQDVQSYSSPDGAAMANEEMRRLVLAINEKPAEIVEKVTNIEAPRAATPSMPTKKESTPPVKDGQSGYSGYSGYSGAAGGGDWAQTVFHNEDVITRRDTQGLKYEDNSQEENVKYSLGINWELYAQSLRSDFTTKTGALRTNISAKAYTNPVQVNEWIDLCLRPIYSVKGIKDTVDNNYIIRLVGDEETPAGNKYYGTSSTGVRGYHDFPSSFSGYSGYSGISGYSGWSGYSGISGYSGQDGSQGLSGYSGISGYSGWSGYSGISGYSGQDGSQGLSGYSGISGYSGWSGYSGISGYSGQDGSQGLSGYSGISGYSGWSGYSGISGETGPQGISGYSGYSGESAPTNAWLTSGNTLSGVGVFGTISNNDIMIKRFNQNYGMIGNSNIAFGYSTLNNLTTGTYNVAIGYMAGRNTSTAYNNVYLGRSAGYNSTSGQNNVGLGYGASLYNAYGDNNITLGLDAGYSGYSGDDNIAIGQKAGYSNTGGMRNISVGFYAGYSNKGYDNVLIGAYAGYALTSNATNQEENVAIGRSALYSATTTYSAVAVGRRALYSLTTGTSNVAVGANAGDTLGTGSSNTFLGTGSDVNSAGLSNTTALGYNTVATASNQVRLGNSSVSTLYCQGAYAATTTNAANMYVSTSGQIMRSTSSRRYKRDIRDIDISLDKFKKIRPRAYKDKKTGEDRFGFIAEEVAEVFPMLVEYDSAGRPDGVQYDGFIPIIYQVLLGLV